MRTDNICPITGLKFNLYKGRYSVKVINHPKANSSGYFLRSRYVMEKHLGRYLESEEHVHHKDENTMNDDLTNLEILTPADHARHHLKPRENILDYEWMKVLSDQGNGYKKIAKITGYKLKSVEDAVRKIRKNT